MKVLFSFLLFLTFSSSAFALSAYKISIEGVSLHKTGDLSGKGEVMAYLSAMNEEFPFSDSHTSIKDNAGRMALKSMTPLFIPVSLISGNMAHIHLKIADLDFTKAETLVEFDSVIDLNKSKLRLVNRTTGEYVDIVIKKFEIKDSRLSLEEYQMRSLRLLKIKKELANFSIGTFMVGKNAEAIEKGAKNYQKIFALREGILENEGGENYKAIVRAFNENVLEAMEESISATDWINEDYPALPNGQSLLISK